MAKYLFLILLLGSSASASQLSITITGHDGAPVVSAAVLLTPLNKGITAPDASTVNKTIEQINEQFQPYVLVVPKGAQVAFPNRDSIKHHVYSFSEAKTFELELNDNFSGTPVTFDQAGIVEVGCNIHDWMLAYVVVTDAPFYATSNQQGTADLILPEGEYNAELWHPNFDRREGKKVYKVTVNGDTRADWQLSYPLQETYDFSSGFSDYE